MRKSFERVQNRGFTLVELLVVIAIIGILVGLLLPAVQAAREAARRMQCSNNVKQLVLAAHNYHDAYKKFGIGHHFVGTMSGTANRGLGYGWAFGLLPYIEQGNLYNQFNSSFAVHIVSPTVFNGTLAATPQAAFSCPSDIKPPTIALTSEAINPTATSSYKGINGPYNNYHTPGQADGLNSGVYQRDSRGCYGIQNITDGTSNTAMIGETRWGMNGANPRITRTYIYGAVDPNTTGYAQGATEGVLVNAFRAINWPLTNAGNRTAGSFHTGGAMFGFGDGSVHFISENIDHTSSGWFAAAPYMQGAAAPLNTLPFGTYQRLFAVGDGQVISGLDL